MKKLLVVWVTILTLLIFAPHISAEEVSTVETIGAATPTPIVADSATPTISLTPTPDTTALDTVEVNQATVNAVSEIIADTGNNQASQSGEINTGDIQIQYNATVVVNTTAIGDQTHFGISEASGSGDLILPNESNYLSATASASSSSAATQIVTVDNQATTAATVETIVNTGNNTITQGGVINSGDINLDIDVREKLNQTIIGDNWVYLQINKYAPWHGELVGWWGEVWEDEHALIAWSPPVDSSTNPRHSQINITNQAQVNHQVTIRANTGNNQLDAGTINTGNINIDINIYNQANTTLIGDHWYYQIINIFSEFTGNIVLPKPDLFLNFLNRQLILGNQGTDVAQTITLQLTDNQGLILNTYEFPQLLPGETRIIDVPEQAVRGQVFSRSRELNLTNNQIEWLLEIGSPITLNSQNTNLSTTTLAFQSTPSIPLTNSVSKVMHANQIRPTITPTQAASLPNRLILGAYQNSYRSLATHPAKYGWSWLVIGGLLLSGFAGQYFLRQRLQPLS